MVCLVADRRHHGEREHDERHVAMPTVPGAGLIVIEAEFILGGLEGHAGAENRHPEAKARHMRGVRPQLVKWFISVLG